MTTQTAATHPLNRVAVYCGAATPADPRWVELAREVGDTLARRGIGVVYGGGRRGLMGAVADGALAAGGEVIGVIPDALAEAELAHTGVSQLIQVQTMHERKACFTQLSDGFITLPGGVGTMDELWEAVSWSQLGYHALPVGLLNAYGYYDKLLEHARPDTPLVALAFECQLFPEVPMQSHDVFMDKIITESAVYPGQGRRTA